ncbi:AAA family ATPase [Geodermatophilus sp. SYSU D00691]
MTARQWVGVLPPAAVGPDIDAAGAALTALSQALGLYLSGLRAAWSAGDHHDGAPGSDAEIARLVAAVGISPRPSAADLRAFRSLAEVVSRPAQDPFGRVAGCLGLDLGERLTVAAVWWAETDPQFALLLGCAHDDGASRHASAALLRLVLGPFAVRLPVSWDPDDDLVRLGVLEPGAGPGDALRLTPAARRALAGLPPAAAPDPSTGDAAVPTDRGVVERVAQLLGTRTAVLLRAGPSVSSRALRVLAGAAADAVGSRVLPGERCSDAELRLLGRTGTGIPLVAAERLAPLGWTAADGPLLALGEAGAATHGAHVVDVGRPDVGRRAAAWTRELSGAGLDTGVAGAMGRRLGARLMLDGPEIATVVTQARREATASGRRLTEDGVWDVARRSARHELHRVATLVDPGYTLEDLVVPPDVRAQLEEVVTHVALQDVVLDGWGFRRRMPRGQGVAVLLSGPPGTGKTMAAEALAARLRQDLYRIDLSAVVSKYIGETEKNLAMAFDEAERAAAVLFFDECDSLFGRRTEQRDAHDRWANLEVNYLLQRVEVHTGLVVLATNKRQALDEALLRRLRFSIRLDQPDADQRRELWRRALPPEAPADALDVDRLAGRELTGGSVQNAALSAAFAAAADGGRIRQPHVTHALRREYDKLGKVWTEGRT